VIRICSVDEVPVGEGRNVVVGGLRIALFRSEQGWYALDAVCPHKQGPLADGILADCSVICPLHERRFSLQTGAEIGGLLAVAAYPVQVRDGEIYVDVDVVSEPARAEGEELERAAA
jgi:nitrite reductase (NADH) small subunit